MNGFAEYPSVWLPNLDGLPDLRAKFVAPSVTFSLFRSLMPKSAQNVPRHRLVWTPD
jgi:hypothetical protein